MESQLIRKNRMPPKLFSESLAVTIAPHIDIEVWIFCPVIDSDWLIWGIVTAEVATWNVIGRDWGGGGRRIEGEEEVVK